MELHKRVEVIDSLLEEAEQKWSALTHALHARELAAQHQEFTHGATLTGAEEGLQYEHDLWQRVEIGLTEMRHVLGEIEHLERQRGVGE